MRISDWSSDVCSSDLCLVTILANSPEAGELLNGEILVIRPTFMAFGIGARTAIFAAPYARDHNIAQKLPRPCRKHVGEARAPRRLRDYVHDIGTDASTCNLRQERIKRVT